MAKAEIDLFGKSVPELPPDKDPVIRLERFVRRIWPGLYTDTLEAQFGPEGLQYIVMGPAPGIRRDAPIIDMGTDHDSGRINHFVQSRSPFGSGPRIPQVGLVNVIRTDDSQEIEYHPVEEGHRRFSLIRHDEGLDISGDTDPATIFRVFPKLFRNGQPECATGKPHFARQVRGLWLYGRDGVPHRPQY